MNGKWRINMIYIIEMEKIHDFSETQHKALLDLTPKDQIYLIAKTGDSLPIDMVPIISKIKARLEIRKLSEKNTAFEKGFLYGTLTRSSDKEKVCIFSVENAPSCLEENCSWNEGILKKTKRKSSPAHGTADMAIAQNSDKTPLESSPQAKSRPRKNAKTSLGHAPEISSTSSAFDKLFHHPSMAEVLPLIEGKHDTFLQCLTEASDSEIGYKVRLEMNFAVSGTKIWELTHTNFNKLRKLCN